MPEAMQSDATDIDTLRKMCAIRGIVHDGRYGAKRLQTMIDEYEQRNAPPETPADKVVIDNPGFSSDTPQTPDWAAPADEQPEMFDKPPDRPAPPELLTHPKHEVPGNITEALEWLGHFSIGRTNLISKYIDTLL